MVLRAADIPKHLLAVAQVEIHAAEVVAESAVCYRIGNVIVKPGRRARSIRGWEELHVGLRDGIQTVRWDDIACKWLPRDSRSRYHPRGWIIDLILATQRQQRGKIPGALASVGRGGGFGRGGWYPHPLPGK